MNHLELEKLANEIRKSIVTAVHSSKIRSSGRIFVFGRYFYISVFRRDEY